MIHTQDADFTLIQADVLDGLRSLEAGSVHCVVTSPPYWGLRDYGTGAWTGGDEGCDHTKAHSMATSGLQGGKTTTLHAHYHRETCPCGATRQDQQLGLEATPDLYVARIVEVFREVWRVLRADGTCWVNLGDSYASGTIGRNDDESLPRPKGGHRIGSATPGNQGSRPRPDGMKPKDLVGIPWRVAFALQADGWYLRSEIIWAKPNPMPESVTDRPTKAHEQVFLLSKEARYFFDQEAVREPLDAETLARAIRHPNGEPRPRMVDAKRNDADTIRQFAPLNGRNVRSVWEIATQPYPEAHFATYPEELVRRCVLAGTSERGCCPVCGKPWEREVEREAFEGESIKTKGQLPGSLRNDGARNLGGTQMAKFRAAHPQRELGWRPGCRCDSRPTEGVRAFYPWPSIPCTVLDPFLGSGTTAYVARKHGRRSIGIELNPAYCDLAARRMQQQSLLV